jgi:hypothetical protein
MSTQTVEPIEMGTKPVDEHAWLQKLVGIWHFETEMFFGPDKPVMKSEGTELVQSVGGLWASGETRSTMPDGSDMTAYFALGYDVSFHEYRGCWFGSMSSHLWKQTGTLSADGSVMTLDCVGPSMTVDGATANYRDVIELIDADHRNLTAYVQDEKGEWQRMMQSRYTRT